MSVKITKTHYEGWVYDLTMRDDPNFFANRVCIHNCAKKKYALHVWDLEGARYAKPKVKVTGIETQKSSTPKPVRDALMGALEILLAGTEEQLREYTEKFHTEFTKMNAEDVAFPRGVNGIEKYTTSSGEPAKGCPGHVKSALMFNLHVANKYPDLYQPISSGDKIKYLHLKPQNPFGSLVFGFPEKLPKEVDVLKYVDWETQFAKSYLSPLENIMNAVNWKLEEECSLDDFFG